MSFWNLSDGEKVDTTSTEYEAPGGFDPLPHNTDVMAFIDEISWQEGKPEYGGGRYINYRISVVKPEAYKNRKSYFKLWVDESNPNPNKKGDAIKKQADKDKRLLGAIAVNAGGGLMNVQGEPTDEDFARELTQKMMVFKLGLYSIGRDDGTKLEGNYVLAVSPSSKGVDEAVKPAQPTQTKSVAQDLGDDIPF